MKVTKSNQIDSKRHLTEITASRQSHKTSYPAQSKRCDATAQTDNGYGRISFEGSAVANLRIVPQSVTLKSSLKQNPQQKQQAEPGHFRSVPSKRPCHYSIVAHRSDTVNLELQCHESIQSLTNHNPHHKRLKYHQNKEKLKQSYRR